MRTDLLIGRDAELVRIRNSLRGRGAILVGPAGVGKTRLAHVVGGERADADVYRVRGAASVASMPLDSIVATIEPQTTEDPTTAAITVLRQRRRARPQVLIVDDAHLFDEESARVIAHLVDVIGCGAVVTQRAGERCPEPFTMLWKDEVLERIEVEPLSPESVTRLASEMVGAALDRAAEEWIVEAARGLPLCVRELVAAAIEDGDLVVGSDAARLAGPARTAAPPRLREVIGGQVERLDEASHRALAALEFGQPVPEEVLARVAPTSSLDALRERGMASDGAAGVELGHPLHGEVAAAALAPEVRDDVRRVLAEALAEIDPARSVVLLLESGGPLGPELLRRALERALSVQRVDLARVIATALASVERSPHTLALTAELTAMTQDWVTADRLFDEARSAATGDDEIADVACAESRARFEFGHDVAAAREVAAAARARLRGAAADAVAAYEMRTRMFVEPLDPVWEFFDAHVGDDDLRWGSTGVVAVDAVTSAWKTGHVGRGMAVAEQAGDLPGQRMYERLRLWNSHVALATWAEGTAAAREAWVMLAETAAQSGNPAGEVLVPGAQLLIAARRGRAGEAARALLETERSARGGANRIHAPVIFAEYAVALASQRVPADDVRGILADLAEPIADGRVQSEALQHLALGRLAFREHGAAAARVHLERGVEVARRQHTRLYELLCHRERVMLVGADDRVVARMDEIARIADIPGGGLPGIIADEARAVVATDAAGLDEVALRAAVFGADAIAWEASVRSHALHRAAGRAAESLIAELRVRQVAPIFAEQWIAAKPVVSILSEREHEVLAEVAAGASNAEVAERLFLSPHTVKRHLERIYARTGLRDRAALADLLARARLDEFPVD